MATKISDRAESAETETVVVRNASGKLEAEDKAVDSASIDGAEVEVCAVIHVREESVHYVIVKVVEPKTRTEKLPYHVDAPCGRVVSSSVHGRLETRNDGEMCGSGACYSVTVERYGGQILVCEHHRDAAESGEFL